MLRFINIVSIYIVSLLLLTSFIYLKDAKSYYDSGVNHLHNKHFIPAIADFTHAISINPRYKEAYFQRAKAKIMLSEETKIAVKDIFGDLLKARELGDRNATYLLWKKAQVECYTPKAQINTNDEIFCLDYSFNNLRTFPKTISHYNSLLALHLSNNKIKRINTLPIFKNLLILDIAHNDLTYLPSNINQLSWIVELNLSFNQLRALPHTLPQLKNLKQLYLRNNKIEYLPMNMSQMQSLEVIDLSQNALKKLPSCLYKLKNLQAIYLYGNSIPENEINALKTQLPNTMIYF
jgi:hypothetical protein